MHAIRKLVSQAIEPISRRAKSQPNLDDYIQVANFFRTAMGKHLINPQIRKVPEKGQSITMESFDPCIDEWEKARPAREPASATWRKTNADAAWRRRARRDRQRTGLSIEQGHTQSQGDALFSRPRTQDRQLCGTKP